MKTKWTKRRRTELGKLHQLLVEVSAMNHGSRIVERIVLCEKLAEALFSSKLNAKNPESFYQFLVGLVIAENEDGHSAADESKGG